MSFHPLLRHWRRLLTVLAGWLMAASLPALVCTWTGNGGDGLWSTGANWDTATPPATGDTANFTGFPLNTCTINVNANVGAVVVDASFVSTLTLGAGQTLNAASFSVSAGTVDCSGGSLSVSGNFSQDGGSFTAPAGTALLGGNFTVTGGTFSAANGTVRFNGPNTVALSPGTATLANVDIASTGGTVQLLGTWTVNGNWIHSSGTVDPGSSTVVLTGSNQLLGGSNSFYNLQHTAPASAILSLGGNLTVGGGLTLRGSPGNLLTLQSDVAGTQRTLNATGTTDLQYLQVKDSSALTVLTALSSADLGNNTGWTFLTPSPTGTSTVSPSPTATATPPPAAVDLSAWPFYRVITVNNTGGPALTDWPVLVQCGFDTTFFNACRSDGADIRFTGPAGNLALDFELVHFDRAASLIEAWVRVPSIPAGGTAQFRIYYGNNSAAPAVNAGAVWPSDAVGVWHLEPGGSALDSGRYGNHGTLYNSPSFNSSSRLNSGLTFNGGSRVEVPASPSLNTALGAFTLLAWNRPSATGTMYYLGRNPGSISYALLLGSNNPVINVNGNVYSYGASNGVGTWYWMGGTYDGSVATQYRDGAILNAGTSTAPPPSSAPFVMGALDSSNSSAFQGDLDEVRLYSRALSSAEMQAEYKNQSCSWQSVGPALSQTTATPTVSATPSPTASPSPTATGTATPTVTPTATPTATATASPSLTATPPTPNVSVGAASASEGAGSIVFTLSLDQASPLTTSVQWYTGDLSALAGSDYFNNFGTVVFPPAVVSQTITVSLVNDLIAEPTETFAVYLQNPLGLNIATTSADGTILDDDPPPALNVSPGAANPPAATVLPGSTAVPLLQLHLDNTSPESERISSLAVQTGGSGDESSMVGGVAVYRDANSDGQLDAGDILLSGPYVPGADNARMTFTFSDSISQGMAADYLVAYDFLSNAAGTFNASLSVSSDLSALGQVSNYPVNVQGSFPVAGGLITVAQATATSTPTLSDSPTATVSPSASPSPSVTPSPTSSPQVPLLSFVGPSSGLVFGGESITLSGNNFSLSAAVSFGGASATVVSAGASSMTVIAPAGSSGTVQVMVINPGGIQSNTLSYTYLLPSPTPTPSLTASGTPTLTPSGTPSLTVSSTPTLTPSGTPSLTVSSTPSLTVSSTPSPPNTATTTASPSPSPVNTATATASPSPSPVNTATVTSSPVGTPLPTGTVTPVFTPSDTPLPTGTPEAPAVLSENVWRPGQGQPLHIGIKAPQSGRVTVHVYNLAAEEVRAPFEGDVSAGQTFDALWDGRNEDGESCGAGVYIVSIQGAGISRTLKVVLLK